MPRDGDAAGFRAAGEGFSAAEPAGVGVVVIEAARRSGTLSTARMAGEQGREVFAVPGHPLDPRAEGTNHLLKNGAALVTSAEGILESLAPVLTGTALVMEPPAAFEDLVPAPVRPPPLIGGSDRDRVVVAMGPIRFPSTIWRGQRNLARENCA